MDLLLCTVFHIVQTPPRRNRFQILHGVTDHAGAGECQHLYSFTKYPQNSAPQAFKVMFQYESFVYFTSIIYMTSPK